MFGGVITTALEHGIITYPSKCHVWPTDVDRVILYLYSGTIPFISLALFVGIIIYLQLKLASGGELHPFCTSLGSLAVVS